MSRDDAPNFRELPIQECCGNCDHYVKVMSCKHPSHAFEVGDYPYEWMCDDFEWNKLISGVNKNDQR